MFVNTKYIKTEKNVEFLFAVLLLLYKKKKEK